MAVELAATEQGKGPPLVMLHGLFGSARNWASIAKRLAERRRVFALDMRNHGASPWADDMDYGAMAEDVCAFLDAAGLDRTALLGHSMGGKAAMLAALRHPGRIERLVVVDVAPAAYRPVLGAYVEAMQAVDLAGCTRRAEVDAQLRPAVPDPAVRQFLLQNLVAEDGRLRWRLNLDAIGRAMPAISGFPEPPDRSYDGPALFVAGGRSDYVRPEHEATIRRLFPRATVARVEDAGHWVHAEQPDAFLRTVEPFLAEG